MTSLGFNILSRIARRPIRAAVPGRHPQMLPQAYLLLFGVVFPYTHHACPWLHFLTALMAVPVHAHGADAGGRRTYLDFHPAYLATGTSGWLWLWIMVRSSWSSSRYDCSFFSNSELAWCCLIASLRRPAISSKTSR